MISYEQALSSILENTITLPVKQAKTSDMLGCFLAAPVTATSDLPMFDNSAVDGFAVCVADVMSASPSTPVKLKLTGTAQAGDPVNLVLVSGSSVKTFTGASVAPGAEAVVMREYCEEENGFVHVKRPVVIGENVRCQGEEYKTGQKILDAGVQVTPPLVGLLCTLGYSAFAVYDKPKVAVIVTGNELIKPGCTLHPGEIYDSNSYALKAALDSLRIEKIKIYHAKDNKQSTRKALTLALASADLVISTGGISVGDYDLVKDVLEEIGVRTIFWEIAIKPGKPVYFGVFQSRNLLPGQSATPDRNLKTPRCASNDICRRTSPAVPVFGLPGNPVSALVTFNQLVKPAILKMMGAKDVIPLKLSARLLKSVSKKSGRLEFVRGIASRQNGELVVQPVSGQDSHMMGGLSQSNCLINFSADLRLASEGQQVPIELLPWLF